jgi:hypothetical protein
MAKNLFTLDGLISKLFEELSWRRKELFLIKNIIPVDKNPIQNALLRSAIPFVYAHWEGFIKVSMSHYLEFVSKRYLKNNELKNSFVTLSIQNKLGEINNNNFENKVKIVTFLLDEMDKQSTIPKRNIINTKSNLTFEVLKEILFILDLDDNHINSQKDLIDDLVKARNHIAHGEFQIVDYATFIHTYDDVIALMDFLKTKIENNAVLELYKKPSVMSN